MKSNDDKVTGAIPQDVLEERYRVSRARLERSARIEQGQSGALMFAAMAYGDTLKNVSALQTMSHLAKLFCIAALFLIPNLLVWYVLL